MQHGPSPRACLVGTAPPRRCGIATFTDDLRRALTALDPASPAVQVALTEAGATRPYGPEVVFEIQADQRSDYRTAAAFVDRSDVDVLCVQHEFGIFGGPAGRHVDELLERVSVPVVTTLHTVLADPPPAIREATRRLAERSDVLVVLADAAVTLLADGCGIDPAKVRVIPHGVPSTTPVDREQAKAAVGAAGRTLLLTFGLLGPDKGIELVIDALPPLVAAHPDLLYVVLGATHPEVLRHHGDAYRSSLVERVRALGLEDHVAFVDRYTDVDELCRHLSASDVYLTPYRGTEQIVSGTLAYAIGLGCAVVSTPYPYARELLAGGRGELVPFGDSAAIADVVGSLLAEPARREAIRARARAHGASMSWPAVAASYRELFAEVMASHERPVRPWTDRAAPAPSFAHLRRLTDDTGVFQHAPHGVPSRADGYCTDDAGRALVVAVEAAARLGDVEAASLVPTHLSFLVDAQQPDGSFANLLTFDRRWVVGSASGDTLGQAVWGLGTTVAIAPDPGWRDLAGELLDRSLGAVGDLHHTRSVAYAMLGVHGLLQRYPGALEAQRLLRSLAERQLVRLADHGAEGWTWFDDAITYANAAAPEALLRAGHLLDEPAWVDAGVRSLDFLVAATHTDDGFDFAGNETWAHRSGRRSPFGQQPIEAGMTARACVAAFEVTGDPRHLALAHDAVRWLLGRNRLGIALYDPVTGRCADGLDRHGASRNAGAESTICALLALLALPTGPGLDLRGSGAGGDVGDGDPSVPRDATGEG